MNTLTFVLAAVAIGLGFAASDMMSQPVSDLGSSHGQSGKVYRVSSGF